MRGPDLGIESVVENMAPRLDCVLGGSTEVNTSRAQLNPSVASGRTTSRPRSAATRTRRTATPTDQVGPLALQLMSAAEVRAHAREQSDDPPPADVELSFFVQLADDLDPEVLEASREAIRRLTRRVRWKQGTGAAEVEAAKVDEVRAVPGVMYVEPGHTLLAPRPTRAAVRGAPSQTARAVAEPGDGGSQHHAGRDVLVGIIDVGGFDFAHTDFMVRGRTRWVAIWDQGGTTRPSPFDRGGGPYRALDYGSDIRHEHMAAALRASKKLRVPATTLEPQSTMNVGSHGTHVASIAAGNLGVARRAKLAGVLVALRPEDSSSASSFYDSTRIADAVDYLLALAVELGGDRGPLPVSINISLGTNGHAHDTSNSMARWIDNALTTAGRCVCVAAGNAGQVESTHSDDLGWINGRIHAGGRFAATHLRHELGWIVGGPEIHDVSENELEIWYSPQDRIEVEVRPPGGPWIGPIVPGEQMRNKVLENGTVLSVYNQTYYPANGANRISVLLAPYYGPISDGVRRVGPIASGAWRVRLTGTVVRDGRYDGWIERDDPRLLDAAQGIWSFPSHLAPGSYTDDRMVNSLACAERLISVANIDMGANSAHVTSSRGPTRDGRSKPDIGAEGTDVVAANGFDPEQQWVRMTGTSMASPYVCGVAALMLGIAPTLTAAQILGIIRTTSTPLAGHDYAWRNDTGFGTVEADRCVAAVAEYVAARASSRQVGRKGRRP
jgi:subtilisin family serine protease